MDKLKAKQIANLKHKKSKKGVITTIYNSQIESSKRRQDKPPTYTKEEFHKWLTNDFVFNLTYKNWVNCGYKKEMKPSVDRLDDLRGYSFDNIQITTWGENNAKGHMDRKNGVNNKVNKRVGQYTMANEFLAEFHSLREAERQTGVFATNISSCCNGKKESTNGFKWKYLIGDI
ncbi:MAG: hypothetical protein KAR40_16025 [Candidatus Sabulitectum sp.]|nr:hypothetical protein [Candidatus Sabulitectum sp.]